MTGTDARRLAVLIDADNTTAGVTTELLEEIAKYGTPTIKRAYGDFTRLATRLRESGMTVYGLGRRATPAPFVAACDRFIYLDLLSREREEAAKPAGTDERPTPPDLKQVVSTAISSTSKDDGWSNLSEVGSYLSKSHAAFDPRDYGHAKLGELVRAESYVEVKEVLGASGLVHLWVRLRPTARKNTRSQ